MIYRLSLRGNRRLNHAIHMAAVTQIRYQHSRSRAYYDKKMAEGKNTSGGAAGPQAADQRRHLQAPEALRITMSDMSLTTHAEEVT